MKTRPRLLWPLALAFSWGCRDDLIMVSGRNTPLDVPPESPLDAAPPHGPDGELEAGAPKAELPDGAALTDACHGPRAAIEELAAGLVPDGSTVSLRGVIATSQKFLVSSGEKCWYGAFATDAVQGEAPAGILMVAAAPRLDDDDNPCPGGRDAILDDLAAGDVIDAFGSVSEFAPSSCADQAGQFELVVHDDCKLQRGARGMTPPVTSIDAGLATELARGSDPTLLRAWGGVLARIENVMALRDGDSTDVVGAYGVIRLGETALEVHDKIFYFDFSGGGPAAADKGPKFGYPTEFRAITGFVYFDYCTWSLAPRNKCTDFDPPSEDCPPASGP